VGETFPATILELTRTGRFEGDLASRAFVLVFRVPVSLANLQAGTDASVAARVAGDQRATFYSGGGSAGGNAGGNPLAGAGARAGEEDTVQLSVDLICDNQWSYESLLEGFTLIKNHYADLMNSAEMGRLRDMGGVSETFGIDRTAQQVSAGARMWSHERAAAA